MLRTISSLFCSRSAGLLEEETHSNPHRSKFLGIFLKHLSIESAEIYGYKIRHDSYKKYVVYKILVKTKELEFKLEKRFSEFLELHEKILKANPSFKTENTFPAKRIFSNMSLDTLLFRKERLTSFLQDVIKIQREATTAELIIMDFFQIEKSFIENKIDISLYSFKEEIMNISVTEDDKHLLEMLLLLNKDSENRINNFSKFHEFFEKCPKLSVSVLQILFKGYGSLKGLISLCGELNRQDDSHHLACCACLKLLCFLMDYEENSNAEAFLEIFGALTYKEFASLGLANHIVESPSKICMKWALKLLDLYKGSNPKTNSFLFAQILDNEEAFETFRKWKSSLTIVSQKTESFSIEYLENSNGFTEDTKMESRNFLRFNSSLFYESKPKSGLFKRKQNRQHRSSPNIVRPLMMIPSQVHAGS